MDFFDFHHHHPDTLKGVYNLTGNQPVKDVLFSVGIHPADAERFDQHFESLVKTAEMPRCVAIGECGLDALVRIPAEIQEKAFEKHIELANQLKKPLIIHCVRRFQEIIRFRKMAAVPMIIHGFNKNQTVAKDLLKHDFYLSFGKALLQNVSLQETFGIVPAEKFFLETDDDGFSIEILYKKAAEIRKCSVEEIQKQIFTNFQTITNGQNLA